MNQIKLFTVEEANAVLPEIIPLMATLLEKRAKVMVQRQGMGSILNDLHVDVGGPALNELVKEFEAIERLIDTVQAFGCLVKDINVGLLDFPAELYGQQVLLCWRYGEESVAHYHGIHEGFNGRSPIN
ncbi:MAG: DUF2203 domain-containing protein [Anaerolineae bacterium]|nr:DUF2203 domain-containing protein [Anaerolineae bacterium]